MGVQTIQLTNLRDMPEYTKVNVQVKVIDLTLQCNVSEIPWTFHKPNRNLYGGFDIRRYKLIYVLLL